MGMMGGMFTYDTGFLLLQVSTYTYFWFFYWAFLVLGTLGAVMGMLPCLRGLRHFALIWAFFVVALLGLVAAGSPLRDSYTQTIARPGCDNSGLGNFCTNNILLFIGTILWVPGMMISFLA